LKRYSEVNALRKALLPKFSSVKSSDRYFPPKKVINDAKTALTRMELFQTWFAAICSDANVLIDAGFMDFIHLNNVWRAITAGDDRYVELLVSARVFLAHVPNDSGLMPLHCVCRNGFAACAAVILRAAQPEHRSALMSKLDDAGMSPLHIASAEGHAHVTSLLLQYGASPTLNSRTAGTPLHAALRNNRREVIELLVGAMVAAGDASHLDIEDKKGRSPLHYAVHFRMRDVVQLLLRSGASVTHSEQQSRLSVADAEKTGHTVLHVAAALNDHDMIQVIAVPRHTYATSPCT
jgi:ankyrin repeat protein